MYSKNFNQEEKVTAEISEADLIELYAGGYFSNQLKWYKFPDADKEILFTEWSIKFPENSFKSYRVSGLIRNCEPKT